MPLFQFIRLLDEDRPETIMDEENNEPIQKINVSGTIFQVRASTLRRFPDSRLANLVSMSSSSNKNSELYFDQDAELFSHILRCCRSGEVHVPFNSCPREFMKELKYWGIPIENISPCCLQACYKIDDSVDILQTLNEVTPRSMVSVNKDNLTVREKMWYFLDDPNYSTGAKIWYYSYLAVVGVSILVYLLWMAPGLRVGSYLQDHDFDHNHTNDKISHMIDTDPHIAMFILDIICMCVFIVEFFLRFLVCPDKLRFFLVWYDTMNAILVITTITSLILELRKDLISTHSTGVFYYVMKNCNVFRLLLLMRLEKQYMPLKLLILAVKESSRELLLLAFSLLMAMCVFGGLMFCAEIHTDEFPDIYISLWWALVTITTVGYGDYFPKDLPGRIIGSLCAICGIMLIALPIAVITSKFSDLYGHRTYQYRHQIMCQNTEPDQKSSKEEITRFNNKVFLSEH